MPPERLQFNVRRIDASGHEISWIMLRCDMMPNSIWDLALNFVYSVSYEYLPSGWRLRQPRQRDRGVGPTMTDHG